MIFALDKPVTYFFPPQITREFGKNDLTVLEKELVLQARRLDKDDLRRLAAQARALADLGLSPDQFSAKDPMAAVQSLFGEIPRKQPKGRAPRVKSRKK